MRRPATPDFLVKPRYQRQLRRRYAGTQPVVVFSLGKVGTTSLARTIEQSGRTTLHCHKIADEHEDHRWPSGRGRPYTEWRGEVAGRMLRHGDWDIVCGVRDPVARAASTLFQIGGAWEAERDDDRAVVALTRSLTELFDADRAGLDWFDAQLRPVTGIDVYAEPFDPATGWQIYRNDRFRVLVVRFEDIGRVGADALAAHLGLDAPPVLAHTNDGGTKSYADRYDRFKRSAELPARVLDAAYGSKLAARFYAPAELDGFRARWERAGT